jgi:hypothetical protein
VTNTTSPTPNTNTLIAQAEIEHPDEGDSEEAAKPPEKGTASHGTLRALLSTYAQSQDPITINQYADGLQLLLRELESSGFDAADVLKRLTSALRDKNTGGYVNLACELAAAGHFLKHFPDGFGYQVPSAEPACGEGTPKNFDFSFVVNGFTFNVEVKSFAPKLTDHRGPPVKVFLPPDQREWLYEQGSRFTSNCAPGIARFLRDANEQLTAPATGLSVMLLCCNDLDEFADALACFIGPYGICNQITQQGLIPAPAQLPNIDAVVICQLGFNQSAVLNPMKLKSFFDDDSIKASDGADAWDYKTALPIGFFLHKMRPAHDLQTVFGEVFRSLHGNIYSLMQRNGNDPQGALFSLFNKANNRK